MDDQQATSLRIMLTGTNIAVLGVGLAQFGMFEYGAAALLLGLLITATGLVR